MTNGSNDWGVPFSHISWFDKLLKNHNNVVTVTRSNDIFFEVIRKVQADTLRILCVREYTMGLTLVQRALNEFGSLDIIYIGGGWNSYTTEAKDYCLESSIGLYIASEMSGALWSDKYWNYHKKSNKGNPIYFRNSA